jgi:hypothetical protein
VLELGQQCCACWWLCSSFALQGMHFLQDLHGQHAHQQHAHVQGSMCRVLDGVGTSFKGLCNLCMLCMGLMCMEVLCMD